MIYRTFRTTVVGGIMFERRWACALLLSAPIVAGAQPAPNLLRSYLGSPSTGWAVADVSDLDRDGKRDFVAGANASRQLIAYSSARTAPLWTATSTALNFGYAMSGVGDIDRDGLEDVLVGAPGQPVGPAPGSAVLLSGANGAVLRTFTPPAGALAFGAAVGGFDDVNGDNVGELLVGAPGSGAVFVISGSDGVVLRTLIGSPGSSFGAGVAKLRDGDGDNVSEIIIGAPLDLGGRVYVHSGANGSRRFTLASAQPGGRFGEFFVSDAGDVNGDGTHDVYVGDYAEGGVNGAAYVFSGRDGARLHRIVGTPGEGLGPGRGAGDVNGDGRADIVVGAYTFSGAGVNQGGRAAVFSGADASFLMRVNGTRPGGQFGFDAVGIGDVNDDGRLDFIVASSPANAVDLFAGVVDRPAQFAINASLSGAWFNARTPGQGVLIEVLPTRREIFLAWFTYEVVSGQVSGGSSVIGERNHRWMTAQGAYSGDRATLAMFRTSGGRFDDPAPVTNQAAGEITLSFSSCSAARMEYRYVGGPSGAFDLSRIANDNVAACESAGTQ
jgi:hypothetical protein